MRINLLLAQVGSFLSGSSDLVLDFLMQVSFVSGIIVLLMRARAAHRGEPEFGQGSVVLAALLAGAPMLIKGLFHAFGLCVAVPNNP